MQCLLAAFATFPCGQFANAVKQHQAEFSSKGVKASRVQLLHNSFETVAREWMGRYSPSWAKGHEKRVRQRLERDIFPWIAGTGASGMTPGVFQLPFFVLYHLNCGLNSKPVSIPHQLADADFAIFPFTRSLMFGR
jgi:hypothetical protein